MTRKKSKNKAAQGNSDAAAPTDAAAAESQVEAGNAASAAGPQQQEAQPVASSSDASQQQPQATGGKQDPSKTQVPIGKPENPQEQLKQKQSHQPSAGQPAASQQQQHPPADKKQPTGGAQGSAKAQVQKPPNQQQPKQKQSQPNAGQPSAATVASSDSQQQPISGGKEKKPVGLAEPQKPTQNQAGKPANQKENKPSAGQITVAARPGGALKPPPRNGIGKLGRPILLSANYFRIKIENHYVYHYDVDINPVPPKALFKKVILQWMGSDPRIKNSLPVFDFKKNIYTAKPIPDIKSKVDINYQFEEKDRENPRVLNYVISIQPTGEVEIDLYALDAYCKNGTSIDPPLRPIQALDIALKYGAQKRPEKILLGSCLFLKPSEGHTVYLDKGLEVWFGHFQSLRLCSQSFLNIDVTQKPFLKSGKVHEIMANMYGTKIGEKLRDFDYKDFSKKITTLKVTYSRGTYMANVGCNGLKFDKTGRTAVPASTEKFDFEGKMITVQQFFEDKLKKKLLFPYLPCVWVGSRDRNNLVPMELCTIPPGQEYRRKLSDFQTAAMIKVAAVPPSERKQYTLDAVKDMQFDKDDYSKALGIKVDTQMVKLQGRVLPAPEMSYQNGSILPKEGVWNMAPRNLRFIDARKMLHFGVINITRARTDEIQKFVAALAVSGRKMGMEMGENLFIQQSRDDDNFVDLEKKMRAAKQNFPNLQILIVIINKKRDPAHELVKRVGDLDLCLASQCVQSRNLSKNGFPDASTMANICLKLNAKLGGINTVIAREFRPHVLLNEQVIIMGADVTHPGADQQDSGKPSIAAVTGSLDPLASKYACEIRIQKSKQEHIEDMENMVYNLLLKFFRYNKGTSSGKPQRIIFYRDGVSEGQFAKILETEMTAIQRACRRLEDSYRPPITFIVVQKRHHTRLYPENKSDMCGRAGNVPPGTVVDTTIVHPTEGDFYLVSHLGIQGTSRPAHYHTLWDDSKFSSDEIQKMTYYLCHLFVRCTRSVSYPAPCYYSHLVAFRGREYYDNLSSRVTNQELQTAVDRWTNFMFFV